VRAPVAIAALALLVLLTGQVGAQFLEEEMRRPPGTNSLDNDSMDLRGRTRDQEPTNSLDDDSMDLRGRTHDQEPADSFDNGSPDGGDRPDPDWQ
jgi:hypothetical protein